MVRTLGVGALVGLGLAIASDVPGLGAIVTFPGLNLLIWIGAWAYLADRFVNAARATLDLSENPALPALGYGALIGALSGVLGQIVQIVLQTASVGSLVSAQGAWLSALGWVVALFLYPAFGAFWGGLFGMVWGGRVRHAPLAAQ